LNPHLEPPSWNFNEEKGVDMADMKKVSEQLLDFAERFADVTDAAQGRGTRQKTGTRWLLLPAAGAGLYALGTSRSFNRQAKSVLTQAKDRASDLPEDLLGRVKQATGSTGSGSSASNGRRTTRKSTGRTTGQRRRKTTSTR
jgi:hypothetical protein